MIPEQADTDDTPMFLATVEDLFSRRTGGLRPGPIAIARPNSPRWLSSMAVAVRGGDVTGVIFHTDKGSEYIRVLSGRRVSVSGSCNQRQRVGSALDNAAAESFFSTLEHERLSRWVLYYQKPSPPGHHHPGRQLV